MNEEKNRNPNKPHNNLLAWQKSMDLVVRIYEITR